MQRNGLRCAKLRSWAAGVGVLAALLVLPGCAKTALEYYKQARATEVLEDRADLLSKALAEDPKLAVARQWRARTYRALRRHEPAIEDYRILVRQARTKMGRADMALRLGEVYEDSGQFDNAIKSYSFARDVDPAYITPYLSRAGVYFRMGEYANSMRDYLMYLSRDLDRHSAEAKNRRSRWHLRRGVAAFCAGEWESSGGEFEQAIKDTRSETRRARAVLCLYFVVCRIGDKAEADQLLNSYALATLKMRRDPTPWFFGAVWFAANRLTVEQFLEASGHRRKEEAARRAARAHYYIGARYVAEGAKQKAIPWFEKCLEHVDLNSFEYHMAKVELRRIKVGGKTAGDYRTLARRATSREEKIRLYGEALRVNPKDTEARLRRGTQYSLSGQYSAAVKDYTRLLELYTLPADQAKALRFRAMCHLQMRDYKACIQDCQAAIRAEPKSWRAREILAVALSYLRQYKAAAGVYQQLVDQIVVDRSKKRFWALQRGYALCCAAEWQGAAAAFRSLLGRVGGDSPMLRANLYIVESRLDQKAEATKRLQEYAKGIKEPSWESSVAWYLADMDDEAKFLKASAHSDKAKQALLTSRACYYIGASHLLRGRRSKAIENFENCRRLGRQAGVESWEYRMAVAGLGRLK